ncbi:hypothetical protein PYCCODRAFT_91482 [Trametes coccinea BRFM310]|uniref:Uncharacterized protein n=1 Tax=Trametes coccinea (strain BRFM310) TaxID=1353009 RepID=A0A1Y2I7B1_TRAC3|nr:hypothetical protein PYCCODRAFT_91482 [Trametes coccinea BRFM310]
MTGAATLPRGTSRCSSDSESRPRRRRRRGKMMPTSAAQDTKLLWPLIHVERRRSQAACSVKGSQVVRTSSGSAARQRTRDVSAMQWNDVPSD